MLVLGEKGGLCTSTFKSRLRIISRQNHALSKWKLKQLVRKGQARFR
jgi:hypothetical protein